MKPLVNIATMRAKAGQGEALGAALMKLVRPTHSEPGCVRYDILESIDEPDTWTVYETWQRPEDFDAHMATDYVRDFLEKAGTLCVGEIDIHRYRPRAG